MPCNKPGSLLCCRVSNSTTACFISYWIISVYILWFLFGISIIGVIMFPDPISSYNIFKIVITIMSSLFSIIMSQLFVSSMVNIYERIQKLENDNLIEAI